MKIKNQGKKAVSIAMSVLMAASLYPVTVVGGGILQHHRLIQESISLQISRWRMQKMQI